MYVAIEGVMGAGKSTLAAQIAQRAGWRLLGEPVETNPMLPLFYADPKRWAFTMQVRMLHSRYRLQQVAAHDPVPCVLDRSLPGDRVFATLQTQYGNMTPTEWDTYVECYTAMDAVRPPMVMLFLEVSPDTAYSRMVKRARGVEAGVPLEYLRDLAAGYVELVCQIESGKHAWGRGVEVVRVPWDAELSDSSVNHITALLQDKLHTRR